jgi:hypothetical protein
LFGIGKASNGVGAAIAFCGALEDNETYPFLWLRTFHNPVAVRDFRRGDNCGLEAVILSGAGTNPEQESLRALASPPALP